MINSLMMVPLSTKDIIIIHGFDGIGKGLSYLSNLGIIVDCDSIVLICIAFAVPAPKGGEMAVELEKVVEENREEIVAQIAAQMRREMPTYEALPIEEVRQRAGTLIDILHRALAKNERQTWEAFVEMMVRQRLEEGHSLAQIQQVMDIVERVLLSVVARAYKEDPRAVRGAKSRFIEGFMFETRATVEKAHERSMGMASR